MSSATNKNCTTCLYKPEWSPKDTTDSYGLCKWPHPIWLQYNHGGALMWQKFQKDQEDTKCPTWTPKEPNNA